MERDRRGVHGGIKCARGRLYIKDEARPRAILGRARRIGRRARFGCNRGGREGKETEAFEGGGWNEGMGWSKGGIGYLMEGDRWVKVGEN